MASFNPEQVKKLYNMAPWSDGYFSVSDRGTVLVHPQQDPSLSSIDLAEIVATVKAQGYHTPLLLRFMDILIHRQNQLHQAFTQAIHHYNYQGEYTAVYPIKVNQQRTVIENVIKGQGRSPGLEAGSKPELLAILGLAPRQETVLICNGYKDREYIRLALIGSQMGLRVIIIVEKLQELEIILQEAQEMKIQPQLGLRVRLQALGEGKWQNTGGAKGKFGLTAREILLAIDKLKAVSQLASLVCLHFHMGSQISNIADIKRGLQEASRYFVELHRLGAVIPYVDVGGGLGVDYEATQSRSYCSLNYSMEEYANSIIECFYQIGESAHLPHPHIFTEVGRAMTAHHAVLVTDVIAVEELKFSVNPNSNQILSPSIQGLAQLLQENYRSAPEQFHTANHQWHQIQQQYVQGMLSLEERAQGESLYYQICEKLGHELNPQYPAHRTILDELHSNFSAKYITNFSIFQSLPDVWAIEQIFPTMPIAGLNQPLTTQGVIHDITCDSDGRMDAYVNEVGIKQYLPLPPLTSESPLLLGFFLVGAYQEMLGDIHNLFGDPHAVDIVSEGSGGFRVQAIEPGDSVTDVLKMVHIDPEDLQHAYAKRLERNRDLTPEMQTSYQSLLMQGLKGYTYFKE